MASSGVLVVLTMSTVPLKLNKLANQERFGLERRKIWDQKKKKRGQRTKEIEMGGSIIRAAGGRACDWAFGGIYAITGRS